MIRSYSVIKNWVDPRIAFGSLFLRIDSGGSFVWELYLAHANRLTLVEAATLARLMNTVEGFDPMWQEHTTNTYGVIGR